MAVVLQQLLSTTPVIENGCRYTWTIDKTDLFSCSIESLQFPRDASNDIPKWSLSVRDYFVTTANTFAYKPGNLSLGVISHNVSTVNARFVCAILNYMMQETDTRTSPRIICKRGECFRFPTFDMHNLNPSNPLTIIFEVSVINVIPDRSNIAQFNAPYNKLSEDLGTLLDNDKFSDVKLVASGHELNAHKNILTARSKVFAAMFQHEMEEHNLNCVTITDVDHDVLKEMLHYMYTEKVPKLDTMAEGLLAAADKYELENLMAMCEESLRRNITIENAACTLILADRHSAKQLKSEALNFFIRNASSVKETQGFRDMATTYSHLIVEAFCAMSSKQMQPK